MKEHIKVLEELIEQYGGRHILGSVIGATEKQVYFWQYRKAIPEAFHAKLIILGVDPKRLIKDHDKILAHNERLFQ